jgi:hypothetical protein
MDLILKSSTTDFVLPDVGVLIKAGAGSSFSDSAGCDASLRKALGQSKVLRALVNISSVVVNDGSSDLGVTAGLQYLNRNWFQAGGDVNVNFTQLEGGITDTQHGSRAGGSLHPQAVAGGASGFLSGADQTKLNRTQGGDITNEPNGFPNRTDSVMSFTPGTLTFRIAPTGVSYDVYVKGVKYTKSAPESALITDTEGLWYFYFDGTGALVASQTIWSIVNHVPIAYIYWDSAGDTAVVFGEERHGVIMDSLVHEYLHNTVGARYWTGLVLSGSIVGDGSLDAHAQVALTNGDVYDEDLLISIRHAAVPTPPFQQFLTPIAQIPVYYLSGTGQWRRWVTTNFPAHLGAARLSYNLYSAPNWTTPDVDTNGKYVAMWLFATNNRSEPVIAVLGQRQDSNLNDAQAGNKYENLISLTSLAFAEMKVLYRLIFQTSAIYANAIKARLRDVQDLRSIVNVAAGTYVPAPTPVFGAEYQLSEILVEQSKTGLIVWETYLTYVTTVLPPGVYRISWSYDWSYSVTNRELSTQVLVDAGVVSGPLKEQMIAARPNYQSRAGFCRLDLTGVTPATHTILVQGMNANAGDTGYMKNLKVEIFRVS